MSEPPTGFPPQNDKRRGQGCLIALAIVGGIALLLGGICVALIMTSGF